MGVFTNIQTALDTQLAAGSFGLTIAYENIAYTPVEGTSFIRPTTLYSGGAIETVQRLESQAGIYQIDVFVEVEKGPGALNTLLDSVRDHFKATALLTAGGDTIIIRETSRIGGVRDESWYRGSIEVTFMCYEV